MKINTGSVETCANSAYSGISPMVKVSHGPDTSNSLYSTSYSLANRKAHISKGQEFAPKIGSGYTHNLKPFNGNQSEQVRHTNYEDSYYRYQRTPFNTSLISSGYAFESAFQRCRETPKDRGSKVLYQSTKFSDFGPPNRPDTCPDIILPSSSAHIKNQCNAIRFGYQDNESYETLEKLKGNERKDWKKIHVLKIQTDAFSRMPSIFGEKVKDQHYQRTQTAPSKVFPGLKESTASVRENMPILMGKKHSDGNRFATLSSQDYSSKKYNQKALQNQSIIHIARTGFSLNNNYESSQKIEEVNI